LFEAALTSEKDDSAMSADLMSHGMDGTLVAPDWAPLSLAEIRLVLMRFPGLGLPIEVATTSPRPFSAASVVLADTGRVFIKRHDPRVRDIEGLVEEHRFMHHLRAHGAPVPRVLINADGETAMESEGWNYELHEVPKSVDLYGDALSWTPFRSQAHAYSAGHALAQVHRAAEGFDDAPRKPRPLVASFTVFAGNNPDQALRHYLAARTALSKHDRVKECAHEALTLLAPFHEELLPLLPSLAPLWTHNDLHGSNLLWSDSSDEAAAVSVIDFGLTDRTNAVHDLAHAIERSIVEWLTLADNQTHPEKVPVHFDHLLTLLDGYESVRPLGNDEAAALGPMTALCHAEFALSEADYFLGILGSEEKARMAYDGWLVGHARWYRSGAGSRLLDALRAWASDRVVHEASS
jgi:Ser/Thr protein kinase RdoA (MazF antagonist)